MFGLRSLSQRARAVGLAAVNPRATWLYHKYRDATMMPFPHFVDNLRLVRTIELMPHDWIVECGTWRGGMAAGMVEITRGRAQYAFLDSFQGLPPAGSRDGQAAHAWQSDVEGTWYYDNCTATRSQFDQVMQRTKFQEANVEIHKGWFEDSLPCFAPRAIAVLRLDADWFDSTLECLTWLFPLVKVGGLVILDDYGTWDGCSRAVHKYLSDYDRPEFIERAPGTGVAFIVKKQVNET